MCLARRTHDLQILFLLNVLVLLFVSLIRCFIDLYSFCMRVSVCLSINLHINSMGNIEAVTRRATTALGWTILAKSRLAKGFDAPRPQTCAGQPCHRIVVTLELARVQQKRDLYLKIMLVLLKSKNGSESTSQCPAQKIMIPCAQGFTSDGTVVRSVSKTFPKVLVSMAWIAIRSAAAKKSRFSRVPSTKNELNHFVPLWFQIFGQTKKKWLVTICVFPAPRSFSGLAGSLFT